MNHNRTHLSEVFSQPKNAAPPSHDVSPRISLKPSSTASRMDSNTSGRDKALQCPAANGPSEDLLEIEQIGTGKNWWKTFGKPSGVQTIQLF